MNSLSFSKINIEGFSSIQELSLQLNLGVTIIINGPNGMGKSTIFASLVWGLYGKNLKQSSSVLTWKRYQPKDYSGVKVEVYFSNKGHLYKVIRCQKYTKNLEDGVKGGDRLLVYCDAELKDIKGKIPTQDFINSVLGFDYSVFINSVMFGQGLKRLIQETNADKKKLFDEIFNLNFIQLAKEEALVEYNKVCLEYKDTKNNKEHIESEIDTLEGINKELEEQYKTDLKELEEYKVKFHKALSETKLNLKGLKFNKNLGKALTKRLIELDKQRDKLKEGTSTSVKDLIYKLYDLLINNRNKEALNTVQSLVNRYEELEKLTKVRENTFSKYNRYNERKIERDKLKLKIDNLRDDIRKVNKDMKSLENKHNNNLSKNYSHKIEVLKKDEVKLNQNLGVLGKLVDNYDWVIKDPLGNQGLKAYLFENSLQQLNNILYKYSELLGFKVEFSIDLDSSRKDFVTLIEKDGVIIDYNELSGGEKQLVNIAMAFAMNEVLTASRGINLAFLDEVFESLSSDNIEVVVTLINRLFEHKTLFLITHKETLPLSRSRVLKVNKVKGLSYYTLI